MCAIDFPDGASRDATADHAFELGMIVLPCGTRSLRFRPPLDTTVAEVDEALVVLKRAIEKAAQKSA
jgi:L-lysine 6-transaminase